MIPEFFKYAEDIIVPYLCLIFNVIFELSHFPKEWCIGIIVPLHKNGDIVNVDNYRGITLLSVFSKIFVYIINKRLLFWADAKDKISEAQAGFREGYSTIDNIFVLQSQR